MCMHAQVHRLESELAAREDASKRIETRIEDMKQRVREEMQSEFDLWAEAREREHDQLMMRGERAQEVCTYSKCSDYVCVKSACMCAVDRMYR
jgi:hypothetical protein